MQLIGIAVLIVYIFGIWKFLTGFRHTNFSGGVINRAVLALLWPMLLIASKSYRQNFTRALRD
ncbi:membrane protein [Neosynechococcus sphagnicola sy1]|uniref:Membrane protein n=1 Tax=Neosynechococcus sphagnicola sy1 TaxID=1497020 RepID=A0A098TMU3_9CYAN|nr:membrane protein [Neosynechococcus sphagnicola sy1]